MTDSIRAYITLPSVDNTDPKNVQQMRIIWNAVADGWIVKKRNGFFYFSRKNSNDSENFLSEFIEKYSF